MIAPAGRMVPCPTCRGPSVFAPTNRWRPFCGERCAGVDLGAWASEAYRVPTLATDPGDADPDDAMH